MKRLGILAAAIMVSAAGAAQAAPQCASKAEAPQVEAAVRGFFAALAKDDLAELKRITAPGFYAYDVGSRFTTDSLAEVIRKTHESGATLEWKLTNVDVHLGCDMAWAAWINNGRASGPGGAEPRAVQWLESAVLRRDAGRWRMEFLHSTRAREPR